VAEDGIQITGTVDNVAPWLRQADIFVAPLADGAGTKLKVVEAMACALPVVGSDIALQGLGGQDGVHYRRANGREAFIEVVRDLIANPQERRQMGPMARALVEERLGWDSITRTLAEDVARAGDFV
jgi:glycosyltransferase involved in cell wall biosynthesis